VIAALPKGGYPVTSVELERLHGVGQVRMLHLNESPLSPSPRAVAAIAAGAATVNRYPEAAGATLAAALSRRTGVAPDCMMFGVGSDELLHFCCAATLDDGDGCVLPEPSFPRYKVSTRLMGGVVQAAKLRADGANDPDALLAAIDDTTRLMFVCNPNNPSGGLLDAADLERLIAGVPDRVLLVLDEAYWEFGLAAGGIDTLPLLAKRTGPWVVLRTFSKAYALAGIRVGYALCSSAEIAGALAKFKNTFSVTNLAYEAALAALEDQDHLARLVDGCRAELARLDAGLRTFGLTPLPTAANFISADLGRPVAPVIDALKAGGILIRDWREPGYETFIRITAGTAEDTDAVLEALRRELTRNI
jgi:histidinol-phosphate aminotransferase